MKQNILQFQLLRKTYQFQFRVGFSLLCLFFFCLFCVLGNWQLHRYHYKKNLQIQFAQQQTEPRPLGSVAEVDINQIQFQVIKTTGEYLNQYTVLLQNQFHQDQLGFDILTPVKIAGEKKWLLVDRGWISSTHHESLTTKPGQQAIKGYIKLIDKRQFILGKNILDPTITPINMQKIDLEELSQLTHQTFYPFILRLDASAPNGYIRDWTIVTVMPERHMGYAVQWFVMAFVLLIAYLCFSCERIQLNRDPS